MSDETGEFFPFRDESGDDDEQTREQSPGKEPNGRTRKDDDETVMMPPAEAEPTRIRQDAATSIYRPVRPGEAWQDEEVWEGRAGVRAPRPGAVGAEQWDGPAPEPPGRWWAPAGIGIVAFALLAMLGWGIYLIVRNSGDDDRESPAVVSTTVAPAETAEPTTAPPTTSPATTAPSSPPPSSPGDSTIPAVRGLTMRDAQAVLNQKGFNYRLRFVATTDSPAGTVIGSDPVEGQEVPADTVVNLIVAIAPASDPASVAPVPAPSSDMDFN